MNTEEILSRLELVRKSGAGWMARCPAHEDKDPSLSVNEGNDGRVLLNCFAGCTAESICSAIGIELRDLFDGQPPNGASAKPKDSAPSSPFTGTDADVDRMRVGLARSQACQEYIRSRGISLTTAGELQWGYSEWTFGESAEPRPALAIPHYVAGKLAGVKYRTIDGTKLFSQNRGSTIDGLYGVALLDPGAPDISIFEGPEDVALAITHGLNAVGIIAAGSKLAASDLRLLCAHERIHLVGDQDSAGQKAMDAAAAQLPPGKVIRVRLPGVKDIGELYAKAPGDFKQALRHALRAADIQRPHFTWDDLETESELLAGSTGKLPFLVQDLIPLDDCTLFAGKEGSLKTLLALYIGKSVANGAAVFGRFQTAKKPVLYLDAENHKGTQEVYLRFFERIGPEQIRFRTLRYGIPSLTDPALLRICQEHRPLLILDSLIRFGGKRDRDGSEMTELMEQIARLVTAGATVLLIHHARRSDEEEYANSFAIGATVAFLYAIVKDETGLVKRVRMVHKKARASTEINRDLVAFPAILDRGMFELDAPDTGPNAEVDALLDFVKGQPGEACRRDAIKKRRGMGAKRNLDLLEIALKRGLLVVRNDKKISFPEARTFSPEIIPFPTPGTLGNET